MRADNDRPPGKPPWPPPATQPPPTRSSTHQHKHPRKTKKKKKKKHTRIIFSTDYEPSNIDPSMEYGFGRTPSVTSPSQTTDKSTTRTRPITITAKKTPSDNSHARYGGPPTNDAPSLTPGTFLHFITTPPPQISNKKQLQLAIQHTRERIKNQKEETLSILYAHDCSDSTQLANEEEEIHSYYSELETERVTVLLQQIMNIPTTSPDNTTTTASPLTRDIPQPHECSLPPQTQPNPPPIRSKYSLAVEIIAQLQVHGPSMVSFVPLALLQRSVDCCPLTPSSDSQSPQSPPPQEIEYQQCSPSPRPPPNPDPSPETTYTTMTARKPPRPLPAPDPSHAVLSTQAAHKSPRPPPDPNPSPATMYTTLPARKSPRPPPDPNPSPATTYTTLPAHKSPCPPPDPDPSHATTYSTQTSRKSPRPPPAPDPSNTVPPTQATHKSRRPPPDPDPSPATTYTTLTVRKSQRPPPAPDPSHEVIPTQAAHKSSRPPPDPDPSPATTYTTLKARTSPRPPPAPDPSPAVLPTQAAHKSPRPPPAPDPPHAFQPISRLDSLCSPHGITTRCTHNKYYRAQGRPHRAVPVRYSTWYGCISLVLNCFAPQIVCVPEFPRYFNIL